ncbi:hypothetical protein ACSBR1_036670 [Camellia fascicularis]
MKALLNSDSTTISPINPRNFTQPKIQTSLHFSPKDNPHHRIPESDFRNPTISTSYRSSKFRKPNQTVLEVQAKVCTGPTAFKVLDTILRSGEDEEGEGIVLQSRYSWEGSDRDYDYEELLPSSELLWITLTTLTIVHSGCDITSAARHPARLLELLWITLTTLTVVHSGCDITLAARLFTSAARHPARLLGTFQGKDESNDPLSRLVFVFLTTDFLALLTPSRRVVGSLNSLGTLNQDSQVLLLSSLRALSLSRACDAVFYKMALCRDKVLVKRFSHHSSPAPILISIETRSGRAVPTMDWVSSLPSDIQLNILGRIPFEEVAGTGILSTTSNWSEHSVILDKLLFKHRGRWIEPHLTEWKDKVTEILTNCKDHIPIRKFILHIPEMHFQWGLYINPWLSLLPRDSIKEVSLDNWNITTYKLSAILFDFSELTRLMLRNCAFYKPFWVFQNLRFLRLEKIAFGSVKVGDVELSTPSLERVELVDCRGFPHLSIRAPILKIMDIAGNGMSGDDVKQTCLFGKSCGYRVQYIPVPLFDRIKFVECLFGPQKGPEGEPP